MWSFERCVPHGAGIVAFEGFLPDAIGGFSWWDMTAEGPKRGAIAAAASRVSFALERFIDLQGLAPSRIVALGFSQGGVLLSSAVLAGELEVAGLGVLAGLVPKADGGPRVRGCPKVFMAHGTKDEVIPIERARHGAETLRALSLDVCLVEDDVGHKVGIEGTRALKAWLHAVLEDGR